MKHGEPRVAARGPPKRGSAWGSNRHGTGADPSRASTVWTNGGKPLRTAYGVGRAPRGPGKIETVRRWLATLEPGAPGLSRDDAMLVVEVPMERMTEPPH
jgi:hypothetical protein